MEYMENGIIENKKVILRLDLNVTIKDNKILDDTKIKKSIPTIKYLLKNNNKLLIMSHLGKVKSEDDKIKNSLKIVNDRLIELLGINVLFVNNTRGDTLDIALDNNNIVMMENTRFEDLNGKLESNCDDELAKYWASLGEVFVNDAFGTTHRKHASNYGISKYLPSYYGFLINNEIEGLKPIITDIKKPFTVIMGGAKVDDKIKLISSILESCDYLLLGGGIANTFLVAAGYNVGSSLYSVDFVGEIQGLLKKYKDKILFPKDVKLESNNIIDIESVKDNDIIYDIGPKTIEYYKNVLVNSKTIFVNGTVGLYENDNFKYGTESLYKELTNINAVKIAGGGDALASINNLGYNDAFDFLSTGGGATLEYIANKKINCFID